MEGPSAAELLTAFDVSEGDVALNQQGRLAPSQRRRLLRTATLNAVLTLVLGGALLWGVLAVATQPVQWWRWLMVALLEGALLFVGARWSGAWCCPPDAGRWCATPGRCRPTRAEASTSWSTVSTYNLPIPLRLVVSGASYDVYVVELPAMVVAMVPSAGH